MKILLSFVGNRDPLANDGTEGAIVAAFKALQPDWMYLFPTVKSPTSKSDTEENAEETKEYILGLAKEMGKEVHISIIPIQVMNPTDVQEIIEEMRQIIRKIVQETRHEHVEYLVSISSGTPQMQMCWALLVFSRIIQGKLYQVVAPQFAEEKERVKEVNIAYLEEENILRQIQDLLSKYQFSTAADRLSYLAKEVTQYGSRQKLAETLTHLVQGYMYWDMLRYEDALKKLKEVKASIKREFIELEPIVDEQLKVLDSLREIYEVVTEDGQYSSKLDIGLILVDLYHNMIRRYEEGNYADSLARFWRIYEEGLFYVLRRIGVDPRNLNKSSKEDFKAAAMKYSSNGNLTLSSAAKVLKEINLQYVREMDQIVVEVAGKKKQSLSNNLEYLRKLRNSSYAAHGLLPVKADDAELAVKTAEHFLHFIFQKHNMQSEKYLNLYPFDRSFYGSRLNKVLSSS
jgi:phage-related protein